MEKAARALDCVPSLTLMAMFEYVPVWLLAGVPASNPLEALKVAHGGLFWMENVNAVPLAALAVGWNA